jgi:O-antigen/teichoic acid export membrane protein
MGAGALVSLAFINSSVWRGLVAIAIPLLWTKGWYELNLELTRSRLNPRQYGWLRLTKVGFALGLGALLVLSGFGAFGPLIGLIVGMFVAGVILSWAEWREAIFGVQLLDSKLSKKFYRYGLPLTASFAVSFVLSGSDRFLIAWFIDESAAGIYSAGYDIAQQTIKTLMSVVNLAAYPLAVNAFEQNGEEAAYQQMKENGTLLLAIGLPSTVGLSMLAPEFGGLFLGSEFQETGIQLLPWIAFGALLSGIRGFHYDMAFQLGNRTVNQVWVLAGAAIVNLGLNVWMIPLFGILGAAYATVASYGVALILSIVIGRNVLRVPILPTEWYKVILSTLLMVVALYFSDVEGLMKSLFGSLGIGVIVYFLGAFVTNLLRIRKHVRNIIVKE